MRSWAGASVASDGSIVGRSQGISAVTPVSAGIYDITLAAGYAIDSTQSVIGVTEVGTLAASGMSSFAVSHTSDTVKRVTCLREGAAGAASALTNMAFAINIVSLLPATDLVN
jgi:hypothetical protein